MANIYGIITKKRLVELEMSQKELSAEAGVSETYLSKILSGKKKGWKYRKKIDEVLEKSTPKYMERIG